MLTRLANREITPEDRKKHRRHEQHEAVTPTKKTRLVLFRPDYREKVCYDLLLTRCEGDRAGLT